MSKNPIERSRISTTASRVCSTTERRCLVFCTLWRTSHDDRLGFVRGWFCCDGNLHLGRLRLEDKCSSVPTLPLACLKVPVFGRAQVMAVRKLKPVMKPSTRLSCCKDLPDACDVCIARKRARNNEAQRRRSMKKMEIVDCWRCLGQYFKPVRYCPLAAEYDPPPSPQASDFWTEIGFPADTYRVHL